MIPFLVSWDGIGRIDINLSLDFVALQIIKKHCYIESCIKIHSIVMIYIFSAFLALHLVV